MVITQRLAHIAARATQGYDVHISICWCRATSRIRVKARVGHTPNTVPQALRAPTCQTLQMVGALIPQYTVVDRGHRFSDGTCWACFWLEARTGGTSAAAAASRSSAHAGDDDAVDDAGDVPWSSGTGPGSLAAPMPQTGRIGSRPCGAPHDSSPKRPRKQDGDVAAGLTLLPSVPACIVFEPMETDLSTIYDSDFTALDLAPSYTETETQTDLTIVNAIVLPVQPSLVTDVRLSSRPHVGRVVRRDPLHPCIRHFCHDQRGCGSTPPPCIRQPACSSAISGWPPRRVLPACPSNHGSLRLRLVPDQSSKQLVQDCAARKLQRRWGLKLLHMARLRAATVIQQQWRSFFRGADTENEMRATLVKVLHDMKEIRDKCPTVADLQIAFQ